MLIVIITRLIFVYIYDISHTSQGMLTSISNSVRTQLISRQNSTLFCLVFFLSVAFQLVDSVYSLRRTMNIFSSNYFYVQVHEKEFLLKDLTTEGLLGDDRRLGEVCSKRVYRILMAQSGCIKTDDVEDGADFFRH